MGEESEREDSLTQYYEGRVLLEAGDAAGALRLFQQSWASGSHANTAYLMGVACGMLGNVAESHVWFARAYELNPANSMIGTGYAKALHEQGRKDEAVAVLARVLEGAPTYGPAKRLLDALRS